MIPEGFDSSFNMALVAVPKGPKVVCWTSGTLKVDDEVTITGMKGELLCEPKRSLAFALDKDSVKA